jgi:hypothetical protein
VQTCQTVRPGAGGLASEKTAIPGRSAMSFLSGNEQPKPKGSHFDALTGHSMESIREAARWRLLRQDHGSVALILAASLRYCGEP